MVRITSASTAPWDLTVAWPADGACRVHDLSQPLMPGIPRFSAHPPFAFSLTKLHGEVPYPNGVSSSAETFVCGGHVGTHIDAFGHVSKDGKVFGDRPVEDAQTYPAGLAVGSVEELEPVLRRAYVVNVPEILGREVTREDAVTDEVLDAWDDGTRDLAGAAVVVRTGWGAKWGDNADFIGPGGQTPGVDLSGARWLTSRGVAVAGADTWAFERMPSPSVEVHVHLLVESGVPIIECLNLEGLVAEHVDSFLLVAAPLRIVGATGSPIRALGIVAG